MGFTMHKLSFEIPGHVDWTGGIDTGKIDHKRPLLDEPMDRNGENLSKKDKDLLGLNSHQTHCICD